MAHSLCTVSDCTHEILNIGEGLCSMHHQRLYRQGTLESKRPRDRVCSVDGCNEKHNAKGLCKKHYSEKNIPKKHRDWISDKCSVEGCDRAYHARGLCSYHYNIAYVAPRHPLYMIWGSMKSRCNSETNRAYDDYGRRGIKVCDEWSDSFDAFKDYMGERPDGHSLDRIDNNGNYEPGNVRWATIHQQCANRRSGNKTTGVGYAKSHKSWQATLRINGKLVLRKRFKIYQDAVNARKEAEVKYAVFI